MLPVISTWVNANALRTMALPKVLICVHERSHTMRPLVSKVRSALWTELLRMIPQIAEQPVAFLRSAYPCTIVGRVTSRLRRVRR